MGKLALSVLKAARPRQWLKNVALFATIFFTGHFFEFIPFVHTTIAFLAFCCLASSNYIFNDILDVERDRKHPFKKFRPIASGALPIRFAWGMSIALLIIGLSLSALVGQTFFIMAALFSILEYSYSLFLKHISVIDVLTITAAYFLRVYAGEAATGYHISIWLGLTVLCVALFLAIGKRRAELTLIQRYDGMLPKDTRQTLSHYSEKLLDTYTTMFANSTFLSYAMFTFVSQPSRRGFLFGQGNDIWFDVPDRKWMMLTIPFVLYGIMRYMQLIYEGKGESPEKVVTADMPLLVTILLWGITALIILYAIGA
jgi:decaprenyl-phosphate phosphoribosyltransferase